MTFTREQLEGYTVPELRRMCVYDLGITGMTKKPKEVIIHAILASVGQVSPVRASQPVEKQKMTGMEFSGQSVITKPHGEFGSRTTTTIHVSCGASSGNFPVVGRSVLEVGEFLREVLNVDQLSTGLVNGKEAGGSYVLKEGDHLEFLKPAGKKG